MDGTTGGMTPTGRRLSGPAADLVQLSADNGLLHTAIAFREPFRGTPALGAELLSSMPFLEKPGVVGIVPLVHADRASSTFVYATGTVWSIAEIVRAFADLGETCGHRAGLELAYVASQMLIEAAEKGSPHGVWSHRSLTPWRLMLRDDGQVRIIGHGLPQVELLEHLANERSPIKEDSFRYAPPERLEGREEDILSDLFALTLIAVEVMVGKPVYDGLLADVRQQAARAEGTYRLYRWREILPATIRDALAPALKYDDDARYRDPAEYVYAVHDLLGSPDIEGPSLMEVVQRVKMAERRGTPVIGGRTAALTREELAAMAADLDAPEERDLPPPRMPRPGPAEEPEPEEEEDEDTPRWARVRRGRRGRGRGDGAAGGKADRDDPRLGALRERLRRSRSEGPPSRGGAASASDRDGDPREALRRRLRERSLSRSAPARSDPDPEPSEAAPEPVAAVRKSLSASSGGAEALLARLRSSTGRRGTLGAGSGGGSSSPGTPRGGGVSGPSGGTSSPGIPRGGGASSPSGGASSPGETRGGREPVAPRAVPPASDRAIPPAASPPSDEGRGGAASWTLRIGDATRPVTLAPDERLADVAWRLAAAHAAPVLDLVGRLRAGWRIAQEGRWWRGDETVAVLDPARPIDLVRVPNVERVVEIRVAGDPPHRLRTPIGTAVPAETLVAELVSWLGLPDGPWTLYVGDGPDGPGVALSPRQLLADFDLAPGETAVLTLKR